MRNLTWCGVVAIAALASHAAPAAAYNVAFCVKVTVSYTDSSNQGLTGGWSLLSGSQPEPYEDNWWVPTAAREPRGARYELRGSIGQTLMSGYLGDGLGAQAAGCTPNYTGTSKPYSLRISSYGSIQSNWQYTYDQNQLVDVLTHSFALNEPPQSGPPVEITLAPTGASKPRVWSGYLAGSYALYRHAGGETGNYFQFYLCECTSSGACDEIGTPPAGCVCALDDDSHCVASNNTNHSMDAGNGTHLTSVFTMTGIRRKYVAIHEMGHIMANKVTEGYANGGDCSGDDDEPCHEPGTGSHAFWSREFDRCAFKEAFADFYAADVWNDHNEDNCAFKYYKTNPSTTTAPEEGVPFDCAGYDGPDPGTEPDDFTSNYVLPRVAYIEKCNKTPYLTWDYFGRGTEIDWLRVFWNMHTNGASPPSYTTIVRWIRDCGIEHGTFGDMSTFFTLDDCANDRTDSLKTNWNTAKDVHTIDYTD